ncbi:MAG: succinate dehydrogenase [Pseudomonadota bacterium]
MRLVSLILFFFWAGIGLADTTCPKVASVLISNCASPLHVQLIEPSELSKTKNYLVVTGTYSSGDRLGVEGLAVMSGEVKSRRLQDWDGVLILGNDGQPQMFNARRVEFANELFNIKDHDQAFELLDLVAEHGASMMQSHLLISNGVLDLRQLVNAPVFYRRIFYVTHDGGFGVWQSPSRLTLYDAAVQLQDELRPKMALNLDMGSYDFCRKANQECGRLTVSIDQLTNLLTFTNKASEGS